MTNHQLVQGCRQVKFADPASSALQYSEVHGAYYYVASDATDFQTN